MVAAAPTGMQSTPVTAVGSLDHYARFRLWKQQHVPLLYDWLSSRFLSWPHGALQWGAICVPRTTNSYDDNPAAVSTSGSGNVTGAAPNSSRRSSSLPTTHRFLYMAERTDDPASDPNTLVMYEVRVVPPLFNKPSDIAKPWIEDGSTNGRDSSANKEFVLRKRILHPGEVNRIRLVTPSVVVTHTDSPNLFLWDMQRQPHRKHGETAVSRPTCTLTGHERNADFAIDVTPHGASSTSARDASIVSGGSDHHVMLWRLRDYEVYGDSLQANIALRGSAAPATANASSSTASAAVGHTDVVEDVSFGVNDANIVVSVARDSALIVWDVREAQRPVQKIAGAHEGDVNCCDVGGEGGFFVVTGGMDCCVRLWDIRRLSGGDGKATALRVLRGHSEEVTSVAWNRYESDVFASGGEDGQVLVWRIGQQQRDAEGLDVADGSNAGNGAAVGDGVGGEVGVGANANGVGERTGTRSGNVMGPGGEASGDLLFRHIGHKHSPGKITDLAWVPDANDRWCIASLGEPQTGGSQLQMWRMSDLVYRSKEDVMDELRQFNNERGS